MKRRIISILLAAIILVSNLALSAAAEDSGQVCSAVSECEDLTEGISIALDYGNIPEDFSNEKTLELEPMLFSNMYFTSVSRNYNSNTEILYLSNGILRVAVYWKQHLYINDYSSDYQLLESRDIPLNVSGWGGICLGEASSFVFYGQTSTEDDSQLYLVTEYDADFNEVVTVCLNDYTTQTLDLFSFSNVVMDLRDQTLTIFADRKYYGYAVQIDVEKMRASDAGAVTSRRTGLEYLYASDSPYRNLMGYDGNTPIYAVVMGGDYPGGIYISAGGTLSHIMPSTALGDNEYDDDLILTDATNMAVSSSHYLVASIFENYGSNNIYLAAQEKETGNESGRFLTNATAFNSEINGTPWIVDLGNDQFALMWERIELGAVNVCAVLLDAAGMPLGQVRTWRGSSLSAMVPIHAHDRIQWVTAENGEMKLYQLQDLDAQGDPGWDSGIVTGDRVWDGTADISWYQDEKSDYAISTAEQLAGLADLVNGGNDFAGKTIRLENDLFMNSTPFGHVEDNQWIPIGASEDGSAVFNGTFDGKCHTIYNMVVPAEGPDGGLFGTIGADGTVKCITLEQGWFDNSASVANINYGEVLFCMAKSYVSAPSDEPRGGICKTNYGLIYGCENSGFIEFSNMCGGIVYQNRQGGTISQCANKGLLYTYLNTFSSTGTSGIAYQNYGWIYNCYNLGAAKNGSNRSAGIVGYTSGDMGCGQVYNCYSLSGYPLSHSIYVAKGTQGKVENCFGNTKPGLQWYQAFCDSEFLTKLDQQLGPMASAWLPDTLGINNGLPIPVAQYNYHTGNYKVQPELWGVSPTLTVSMTHTDTVSLSRLEYYFTDAALEITSDNVDVAEVVGGKIQVNGIGNANILLHFDETEESTALDYTISLTVQEHSYGAWTEVAAATCTAAGQERRECSQCDVFETREIPALGHAWDEGVVTAEPSKEAEGEMTYTCGVCGEIRTERIPAVAPEYTIAYTNASISLAGDIGVNYYAQLSDAVIADDGAYMQFTVAGQTQTVPVSEAEVSADGTYRFSCKVAAKQMTEDITGQMYLADGTAVGDAKIYSVKAYCDAAIPVYSQYGAYADLVTLMKAMLNYGAYSQISLGYATDNLANAGLTEAERLLPETVDASAYAHSVIGSEDGIMVYSASLLLESKTTIRFYFPLTGDKTIDRYEFLVNGTPTEPTASGSLYYVDVPNVAAKDLDEMQTVTVGGMQVSYCGLSYVNQMMTWSGITEAGLNVVKALYVYNQAANAYFE